MDAIEQDDLRHILGYFQLRKNIPNPRRPIDLHFAGKTVAPLGEVIPQCGKELHLNLHIGSLPCLDLLHRAGHDEDPQIIAVLLYGKDEETFPIGVVPMRRSH